MAKKSKKPIVVFKYSKFLKIGDFIIRTRGIVTNFINNATALGTPSPTTTVMSGFINDLETAEDNVQTKTLGTTTTRDLKYDIVLNNISLWEAYVQKLVDDESNPATKLNIIALSGFDVKGVRGTGKPDLAAKFTINPANVKLRAKSPGPRTSYNWQMSANNGTTWIDLPTTLRADTLVTGLTSKAAYKFRVRFITKLGTSGWKGPADIVMQ